MYISSLPVLDPKPPAMLRFNTGSSRKAININIPIIQCLSLLLLDSIKLLPTSTLLPDYVIIMITFNILYVYLKLNAKLNIIISLLST